MERVLIIGLDGATFDNLKPWIKEGKLPNFAGILENGAHGILKSTIPTLTAPAWTSLFTGKNPGKHGFFDFFIPKPDYSIQLADSTNRKAKPIWVLISDAKGKSGVINMPMTYPPDKFDGFMITGLGTPRFNEKSTYPRSLWTEISNEVPGYKIHTTGDFFYTGDLDKFVENIFSGIEERANAVKYLMDKKEWDLFTTVFRGTDSIQHFFWKFMDPGHPDYNPKDAKKYGDLLLAYYQKIDSIIGDMLGRIDDDTTVIMVSDHGFMPAYKGIYINNWLIEKKLLILKKGVSVGSLLARIRFMVVGLIKKYDIKIFTKYVPKKIRKKVFSSLNIDWSRTKVYFMSQGGEYLMINLQGRESSGVIEPGREYEELRDFIISELTKLKDPETGAEIIDKVYKREDIYTGPFVENAPDLFVSSKRGYHLQDGIGQKGLLDTLTHPQSKNLAVSGVHNMNGIFIIKGPHVKKGTVLKNANIIDVAPTILYLMGVPIPDDMDGKVLTDALEESYLKDNPIRYIKDKKEHIKEKIKDLKALGRI